MAKQQVKFYSMTESAFASAQTKNDGGIYFISDKNEIYKGATRFGAAKVFTVANAEGLGGLTGMVRGDLAITGAGAAWTYVGSSANEGWKPIGGDISALQASWRADIVAWTEGLVMSSSTGYSAGALNIITDIVADEDGKLEAVVQTLPWADLVSRVEAIESVVRITKNDQGVITNTLVSANTVSATDGNFTNITASAATFSATTVSATTMTVGGVALNNISTSYSFDADSGVQVSVTTERGGVTGVDVAVTGNLATFAGKSVVTAISSSATDNEIPTAKAIATKFATLDNAMHFVGVYASTGGVSTPAAGDVIVIGSQPATGFAEGQEYVYTTDNTWELIGDQNAHEVILGNKANTGTAEATGGYGISGSFELYSNQSTHSFTLTVEPVTASTGITTGSATVVTAGAVADYVGAAVTILDSTKASVGASVSTSNGVQVSVQLFSNAEPSVFIAGVGTVASKNVLGAGIDFGSSVTDIPTAAQVYSYVEGKVGAVSAAGVSFTPAGETKIFTDESTVQEALNTVDTEVGTLKAAVSNFTYSSVTGGTSISTSNGVTVSVFTASTTAFPSVTLEGVGTAASKNFTDTLTSTGTSLPTESAVYAAITTALSTSITDLTATISDATSKSGWDIQIYQEHGLLSTVTLNVNKMSALEELDLVWMGSEGPIDIPQS